VPRICLDIDDGSILRTRWDLLLKLKEHYPKLKVSLFWIPYDHETESNSVLMINFGSRLKMLKENQDWIEIIPHGLTHSYPEFEKADREATLESLRAIETILETQGIKYVKGFKAPNWLWNEDVISVLDEKGWFGAVNPNHADMLKTKKYYEYTDTIYDEFWKEEKDFYGLHGHMTFPEYNNLEGCMVNLMKIPRDAEFVFVSEVVCE